MEIGINTFGLSKYLYDDFEDTLEKLKSMGITVIEPIIVFSEDENSPESIAAHEAAEAMKMTGGHWPASNAGEKIQTLRSRGFKVSSIHIFGPGWEEPLLDRTIEFAKNQGVKYIIISPNETSVENAKEKFAFLPVAAKRMKANGIELLMHNHETDLQEENGKCVMDYLLETIPELGLELDVGWVKFAGKDCIRIMKRYKDRIRILHFKDISEGAAPENRNTCFCPVGEGSIPLRDILTAAEKLDLDTTGYIIDQDDSPGDMMQDIALGERNIQNGVGITPKCEIKTRNTK